MNNSFNIDHLITKTRKGKVVLFFPHFGDYDNSWFPFPYLYLAPFLEKTGFEVKIIDARVEKDWKNILTKELKDSFALGITSMSGPDLIPAIEASEIAQGMDNHINIIWGGHHASALPDEVFDAGVADYVLLGPAEFTFPVLLLSTINNRNVFAWYPVVLNVTVKSSG